MKSSVGILGLGVHLPSTRLTNEDVAAGTPGINADWITRRTGVCARRQASADESTSDLAASALRRALSAAGLSARDLDLLIVATATPDELVPATACRVQALTGATQAVAMDVNAACAGWLFATKIAHDWLRQTGRARYAAVIGAETHSRFLNPADRATAVLFGDGAAAAILGPVEAGSGFADFQLGSDGGRADLVRIPGGGSRFPASPRSLHERAHTIHMDGRQTTAFVREAFPHVLDTLLTYNGLQVADVDAVISHQPNPVLLRELADQHGISDRQLVIIGDQVGNIGAACVPYALAVAAHDKLLSPGSVALLAAFGAGLTWGGALLRWTETAAFGLSELDIPSSTSQPSTTDLTRRH